MQQRLSMSKQGKDGGKEINLNPLLTHAITDPKTGAWVLYTKRKQAIPGLPCPTRDLFECHFALWLHSTDEAPGYQKYIYLLLLLKSCV